jgi:membrane protein
MQNVWVLIKETFSQWSDDKAARLGAALAYYAVFSLGPLLVVVIAVAGLAFGQEAVRSEVTGALKELLGDAGANGIEAMLAQATRPSQGSLALITGGVALVLGAIGVVVQLKDALNTIWNVETPKEKGLWPFLRTYVISTAAVMALAFLLLISMLMSAAVSALGGALLPAIGEAVVQIFNLALNFAAMTLLFAMMFKWLPDVEISWRDVAIGAVVTALLFTIGRFAIGFYLESTKAESAFGASASLIVVLVWVYYTAQIVFLGAEFTQVYSRRYGSRRNETHGPAARGSEPERLPERRRVSSGAILTSLAALTLAWFNHRRTRNQFNR